MPSTPWSVIYNQLSPQRRAHIEARNKALTKALERYAAEREGSPEASSAPEVVRSAPRARPRIGSRRKRVQCFGHGVLNEGPHYRTAWQDVWLRWKGSDRKVCRAAPCVLSYNKAMFDLLSAQADLQCETEPEERARLEADVAERQATVACLDAHRYHATDGPWANVTTWAMSIDRAEAERMLAHLLEAHYGVRNPKFVWRRHKSKHGPVVAHSFMPEGDTES